MTAFKFDKIRNLNSLSKSKTQEIVPTVERLIIEPCDATCDFPNLNDVNVIPDTVYIPNLDSINDAFDSLINNINASLDTLASNDVRLYNDLSNIHDFLENLTNGLSETFGCFCNFKIPELGELCPSPCSFGV